MAWTWVNSGTAATGNNATSLAPVLPVGWAAGDLHVLQFQSYGGSINSRVPSLPAGWTAGPSWQNGTARHAIWWRVAQLGDTAPTVTLTGSGVNGDTQLACIHGFRTSGTGIALRVTGATSTNATADNIGPVTGITATFGDLVLVSAGKTNDFNGTGSATGYTLSAMTESTGGNDAGMALLYSLSAAGGATGAVTVQDTGGTASTGLGFGVLLAFYSAVSVAVGVPGATATGISLPVDTLVVTPRPPGALTTVLGLTGTPWRSYREYGLFGAKGYGDVGILDITAASAVAVPSAQTTGAANELALSIDGAVELVGAETVAAAKAPTVTQAFGESVAVTAADTTGQAGVIDTGGAGAGAVTGAETAGAAGEVFVGVAVMLDAVQGAGYVGTLGPSGSVDIDLVSLAAVGSANTFITGDRTMQSRIPATARVRVWAG